MIEVTTYRDRVGLYASEQQAIEAAMDYSRDADAPCTITYPNGRYQDTRQRSDGEWTLGPIFVERVGEEFKQAAE